MRVSASAARCSDSMPRVFSSMNRNSSGKRGEALAHAGQRPVVGGEVRGGESRRHAERRADVQRQRGGFGKRRALLARGIGELVPPQRAEIHADAAEHAEGAVEAVAGIALGQQLDDMHLPFVAQRRLDGVADARHRDRLLCAKYSSSSSVFISTKEVRIQRSKSTTLLLIGVPASKEVVSGGACRRRRV